MKTGIESMMQEIITAEWCVKSDGNVEAPTGYFAIVEIPVNKAEREQMFEAAWPEWPEQITDDELPDVGWYFVVEDSQGFVHVMRRSQNTCWSLFNHAAVEFNKWNTATES